MACAACLQPDCTSTMQHTMQAVHETWQGTEVLGSLRKPLLRARDSTRRNWHLIREAEEQLISLIKRKAFHGDRRSRKAAAGPGIEVI